MTPFEQFLIDNNLKKSEVAKYLGITNANMTKYAKGDRIPPHQLKKILRNKNWDCSALKGVNEPKPDQNITMLQMMQKQLDTMSTIIGGLAQQIAAQQAVFEHIIFRDMKEKKDNEGV